MTEPWSAIQADHDRIWDLLNSLTGGGRDPVSDPSERGRIAKTLIELFRAHEAAEEKVVWPAVLRRCPDGAELLGHGRQQETDAARAVRELSKISPGSVEFTDCVNALAGIARQHLSYEQSQVWPRLADALTPEETAQLAGDWEAARA